MRTMHDPTFVLSNEAAPIPIDMMAYRSDRRGVKPIATLALRGRSIDWLLARGFSIMARSIELLLTEAEDTFAV